MKHLTLLRHAKSSWDDSSLSDSERPLSARGLRDAPRMGQRLAARGLQPDLILTSPATRARQTAELFLPAFDPSTPELMIDPEIYLANPGELLAVIAAIDDRFSSVILVGHNPGMTRLANAMLPELNLQNLPTAGAVATDCETDQWQKFDSARLTLGFYDFPKNATAV